MDLADIKELSQQARVDGRRLFRVSEFLYKFAIYINWIGGTVGAIAVVVLILQGGYFYLTAAILLALFVAFICVINYMLAVLSTHVAKVLVHTSLACVALIENKSLQEN